VRSILENRERMAQLTGGRVPTKSEFASRLLPIVEAELKAAKSKRSPWSAYFAFEAAGRFTRAELLASLSACADADLALKSSGDSRLVIERLLWTVCGADRER
jgi:DNA polymerase-3 subunit delta